MKKCGLKAMTKMQVRIQSKGSPLYPELIKKQDLNGTIKK